CSLARSWIRLCWGDVIEVLGSIIIIVLEGVIIIALGDVTIIGPGGDVIGYGGSGII
ncbi:38734_t:CDS:1, partial [Gigaspora margarita]